MLHVFQFDKILDYRNTGYRGLYKYGLRDKDLFDLAKKEIKTYKASQKPFGLFISTTDTHFPNGIYDERMEAVISPKNSNLEFTVASLDFLIGDFISFLEKENMLIIQRCLYFQITSKWGMPQYFMTQEKEVFTLSPIQTQL